LRETLLNDVFFWLGFVSALLTLCLVPQLRDVLLQTVETSGPFKFTNLLQGFTWTAWGFLVYWAFLLSGTMASLLYVVPPSFLSEGGKGTAPRAPAPPSVRDWAGVAVYLVFVLFCVLLSFPAWLSWVIIAVGVIKFHRPMRWCSASFWFVWWRSWAT
jgi:hypothetical protein